MEKTVKHIEDIRQIRDLMEKSSRFISLSGLSGISAGIIAMLGVLAAYLYIGEDFSRYLFSQNHSLLNEAPQYHGFFFVLALIILLLAIVSGIFFTVRKVKKDGVPVWGQTSKLLIINLSIPLVAGGIFCLLLYYHNLLILIAPATLIFYGLALINASKWSVNDIRYLGFSEIGLGLIATFFAGWGLIFWIIGFGVLHIVYGTAMYFKYER